MPEYILENSKGEKFQVSYDQEPTTEMMNRDLMALSQPGEISKGPSVPIKTLPYVEAGRSAAEMTGLLFGGATGGPLGAGLGYSGLRQGYDRGMEALGIQKPQTPMEATKQALFDVPIGMATETTGQIIPKAISGLGKGMTYPWGAYTGAGSRSIKEAYKGGKGFTEYLRGQGSLPELVTEAKTGLSLLKESRASEYLPELEKISKIKGNLNLDPLYKEVQTQMKNFNIKPVPQIAGGGFDYTNSVLEADSIAQKEFEKIINLIEKRKAGLSTTPRDVDILKQNLQDIYSPNSKIRALTTRLEGKTKEILHANVPGYQEMTANYAKDTQVINEVMKDFSLGDRASAEQGLRKLTNTINENNQFRQELLDLMKEKTGIDLMPKLAGLKMQSWIPTSLVGRMGGMYEIFQVMQGFDPRIAGAMLSSSPRIVGEFVNALGKVGPTIVRGSRYAPLAVQSAYQPTEQDKYMKMAKELLNQP